MTDEDEIAQTVMISALAQILKNNEGVVIHQDGEGFVVYRNSAEKTITILGDDSYLNLEHGKIIEMKYDKQQTSGMAFEDLMPGPGTIKH